MAGFLVVLQRIAIDASVLLALGFGIALLRAAKDLETPEGMTTLKKKNPRMAAILVFLIEFKMDPKTLLEATVAFLKGTWETTAKLVLVLGLGLAVTSQAACAGLQRPVYGTPPAGWDGRPEKLVLALPAKAMSPDECASLASGYRTSGTIGVGAVLASGALGSFSGFDSSLSADARLGLGLTGAVLAIVAGAFIWNADSDANAFDTNGCGTPLPPIPTPPLPFSSAGPSASASAK